jgi:hypothetical protein
MTVRNERLQRGHLGINGLSVTVKQLKDNEKVKEFADCRTEDRMPQVLPSAVQLVATTAC